MLRDNLGRPASDEAEFFLSWAEAWFAAEAEKGVEAEDTRARFNSAAPMLISLLNAMSAARAAEDSLDRFAS